MGTVDVLRPVPTPVTLPTIKWARVNAVVCKAATTMIHPMAGQIVHLLPSLIQDILHIYKLMVSETCRASLGKMETPEIDTERFRTGTHSLRHVGNQQGHHGISGACNFYPWTSRGRCKTGVESLLDQGMRSKIKNQRGRFKLRYS